MCVPIPVGIRNAYPRRATGSLVGKGKGAKMGGAGSTGRRAQCNTLFTCRPGCFPGRCFDLLSLVGVSESQAIEMYKE
jgi:hypothetical protein